METTWSRRFFERHHWQLFLCSFMFRTHVVFIRDGPLSHRLKVQDPVRALLPPLPAAAAAAQAKPVPQLAQPVKPVKQVKGKAHTNGTSKKDIIKRLSKRWQLLTRRVKSPFEKETQDADDWDTLLGFRKAAADFDDASRIDCILAKRELILAMSATNDHRLQLIEANAFLVALPLPLYFHTQFQLICLCRET